MESWGRGTRSCGSANGAKRGKMTTLEIYQAARVRIDRMWDGGITQRLVSLADHMSLAVFQHGLLRNCGRGSISTPREK